MHNAPAVRYPVVRSSRAAATMLIVWLAGACVCTVWGWQAVLSWRQALAAACLLLCAAACWRAWRALPEGSLRWDGQAWWWIASNGAETSTDVSLRLDLQQALLLALRDAAGTTRWGVLERAVSPRQWNDLRRAVCSPVDRTALPGPGSAPA